MSDPDLVLKIAAGVLLAQFVAWLVRSFCGSYLRTRSTLSLALAGVVVVVAAYAIGALAT